MAHEFEQDFHSRLEELYNKGLTTRQANAEIPKMVINDLAENNEEQVIISFGKGEGRRALAIAQACRQRAAKKVSVEIEVGIGKEHPVVTLKRINN